jgi:hypothetical protein
MTRSPAQAPDESRPEYLARIFAGKVYTLDGDAILDMVGWCLMFEVETPHALELATMRPGTVSEWFERNHCHTLARLS